MAGTQNAELDEIQFSHPGALDYWQGVHSNSIQPYLTESPFFDHTSKNGVLWGQAINDGNTMALYADRQRLEQTLRSRPGIEYMVVGEPQPVQDQSAGPDSGVWVIRKQERVKRSPREDELTTLGTYYAAGPNVYQAPSVYDVVGNHLLSAMTSLSKFMEEASSLPIYSPAQGYTWLPPTGVKAASKTAQSAQSREESVAPDQSSSQRAGSLEPSARSSSHLGSATQPSSAHDARSDLLLEQSLQMTLAYGDEYMDENPLRGEPGNFVFTFTKDHLRTRQAQEAAAVQKAKEKEAAEKARAAVPFAFSSGPSKADGASQQGVANSAKRKGSKTDGKKRRKSRIAMSPTSASASASPAAIGSPRTS